MKKRLVLTTATFLLCASAFYAADVGTLVQTNFPALGGGIGRIEITWVSGTNNNQVASTNMWTYVRGKLGKVEFVPSSSLSPCWGITNYTITLKDSADIDLLAGRGANLSSNTASTVCPGVMVTDGVSTSVVPAVANDLFVVAVTNCGNSKSGKVVLYVE